LEISQQSRNALIIEHEDPAVLALIQDVAAKLGAKIGLDHARRFASWRR
jgi:hypothetical protein